MLNIEKYEEELKKCGVHFGMAKEGQIKPCHRIMCKDCLFNGTCSSARMIWLTSEYKEPILSDEAKAYLKAFIEPFSQVYKICRCHGEMTDTWKLRFFTNNGDVLISYNSDTEIYEFFKYMKIGKGYDPEELGL